MEAGLAGVVEDAVVVAVLADEVVVGVDFATSLVEAVAVVVEAGLAGAAVEEAGVLELINFNDFNIDLNNKNSISNKSRATSTES